ncbi:hypothetical protein FBU30_004235 [Linnemannia zychae]|nr:hypothetical protein FBU30_004235 [Linnemannia zychae]
MDSITNDQDFIAFEDSESDVEIDLSTAPPKKPVPKVPKHFRKSNPKVYDNISVYAPPDSNLIFRCSQKRADWYLSRNLARSLSPTSIHLNFEPAGQGHINDPYYLEERDNRCVMCGQETADAGATMLHVVPEQYRKWFPIQLKSHSSHDIVVACPDCNAQWDREAAVVRKMIVKLYNIPLEGVGWIKDREAGLAKTAAGAVVADWKRLWQEHVDRQNSIEAKSDDITSIEPDTTPIVSTSVETKAVAPEDIKDVVSKKTKAEVSDTDPLSKDMSLESSPKKKKAKVKKVNVIPRERMKILETNVVDWWNNYYIKRDLINTQESVQQKRELGDEAVLESSGQESGPRKKLKSEDHATRIMDGALDSSPGSILEPEPVTHQQIGISTRTRLPSNEIEVPLPPPGYTTNVTREMLIAALDAQASYKGPDYKDHGQLVIARVMASTSSGEYYKDENESEETRMAWQQAEPLENAPVGWRDIHEFIRTWRGEFLKRAKPKHLSAEWRIENPTTSK